MMERLTDRHCIDYARCKHRVARDKHTSRDTTEHFDAFLDVLWSGAVPDHSEVLRALALRSAPYDVHARSDGDTSQARDLTEQAMRDGVELIYRPVLLREGEDTLFNSRPEYCAKPDMLRRIEGDSRFGSYSYEPVYIRMGGGMEETDWGTRPDNAYTMGLTFCALVLEHMLGSRVSAGSVYNMRHEFVPYMLDSGSASFIMFLEGVTRALCKRDTTRPVIGGLCGLCPWQSACLDEAKRTEELTLIFYLGEKVREGMFAIGIHTISQLAAMDEDDLIDRVRSAKYRGYFYRSFTDAMARSLRRRAALFMEGMRRSSVKNETGTLYRIYTSPCFPDTGKEIHYDIEDDPVREVVYLHGLYILERGKKPVYRAIVVSDSVSEEDAARELWKFFDQHRGVPVYHYAAHERKVCARLRDSYHLSASTYDAVFGDRGSAIDLYEWVLAHTDWPLSSYGLKPLCKYLGFSWSAEDAGGASSVSWYDAYRRGDTEKLQKILQYNKEDCMATAFLKQWLVDHRSDLIHSRH